MCRVMFAIEKWTRRTVGFVAQFLWSILIGFLTFIGIWVGLAIALTVVLAMMVDVGVAGRYMAYLIGCVAVAVWTGFRSYRIYKTLPLNARLNARHSSIGDAAYGGAVALVFMSTIGSLGSEGMDFLAGSDDTGFLTQFVGWGTLIGAAVVVLLGADTVNRRAAETVLRSRIDLLQKEVEQLKAKHSS